MIKVIFAIALMFIFMYRLGILLNKLLNKNNDIPTILVYGFTLSLAIFEVIGIPFAVFHLNGKILFYLAISIYTLLFILSFIYKRREKVYLIDKEIDIAKIMAIIIVITLAFTSAYLFMENADDSYYVSMALENVNNKVGLIDPSTGIITSSNPSNNSLTLYETYMGVLAKGFNINVAIFFHTVATFVFMILSFCSYYILSERLFENKKKRYIFIIALSIVFLFSGYSNRVTGAFLLGRIWQGKSVFLNLIIPFVLFNLVDIEKDTKNKYVLLWILGIASVCLTPIAIYYVPIIYGLFGLYFLLKRNFKTIIKLIVALIPNIILFVLFILISKLSTITGQIENSGTVDVIQILKNFIGTGYHFYLFIISVIIVIFIGNKNAKIFFVFIPAFAIISILNPIIGPYIAKYVTNYLVYWRMFWLLPIELCIGYTIVRIYEMIDKKSLKIAFLVSSCVLIIVAGKFMYLDENGYKKHENLYKIPDFIVSETNYILENSEGKQIVIAPLEPLHAAMMRQLSNDIVLFWSRDSYMFNSMHYNQEEIAEREKIYNIYKTGKPEITVEEFNDLLEKYDVDWLIIENVDVELIMYLEETELEMQIEDDKYIIFRR